MTSEPSQQIPVLTDVIASDTEAVTEREVETEILREDSEVVVAPSPRRIDTETLIAELQTRLAAGAFALTEDALQSAIADVEARLHEQISARLRRELPELIDAMLREHLADHQPEHTDDQ